MDKLLAKAVVFVFVGIAVVIGYNSMESDLSHERAVWQEHLHRQLYDYTSTESAIDRRLQGQVRELPDRPAIYSIPTRMVWGQEYVADIEIGPPAQEKLKRLAAGAQSVRVRVASSMDASLKGGDFKIVPADRDGIAISGLGDSARWSWFVTPLAAGTHHLSLSVTADVLVGNVTRRVPIYQPAPFDIHVEHYLWREAVADGLKNWPFIAGISSSVVTAVSALVLFLRRRKKQQSATDYVT